jgi:Tol biopolymer transport system component
MSTIWVVNQDGTGRRALISSPDYLDGLVWARDGRHLAYWAWSGGQATERMSLMVADADGNGSRALFDNGVTAAPPIVWSPDGTMIAIDDGKAPKSTTSVIDATTGAVILTHEGGMPTWSPDSSRLAIVAGPKAELQIIGLDGVVEMTMGQGVGSGDWSPDGKHIAFATNARNYTHNMFVVDVADGTQHDITDGTEVSRRRLSPQWSPDGSHVMYEVLGFGDNNVRGVSVWDGTDGAVAWLDIPSFGARWSPDGLTILSHDGNYTTSMFITDPTGVRPQTTIDVSDLHAGQFSMSWQRVAP